MQYQIENLKIAPINKKNSFVVVNHLHEQLFNEKRNLSFFIDRFRGNRKYYYILNESGDILGYYAIFEKLNIDYIAIFGLLKEHRNQNIGTLILKDIINKSIENKKHIKLHVNVHNMNAIKLYQNAGFKIIKTNQRYYDNGDNAYTMLL